jgi:hypothetical protein
MRLLLAIVIGAGIGVVCALAGNAFGIDGGLMGGVGGGLAAGVIAATLRPKPNA